VQPVIAAITLLLFFAASSLGSFEAADGFELYAILSLSDSGGDFSTPDLAKRRSLNRSQRSRSDDEVPSESPLGHRSLKRVKRGKPSLSALAVSGRPPDAVRHLSREKEFSFPSPSSTTRVYQQISVYRI
jgi:hypothetical protein